jgi:hypothetical protein
MTSSLPVICDKSRYGVELQLPSFRLKHHLGLAKQAMHVYNKVRTLGVPVYLLNGLRLNPWHLNQITLA